MMDAMLMATRYPDNSSEYIIKASKNMVRCPNLPSANPENGRTSTEATVYTPTTRPTCKFDA